MSADITNGKVNVPVFYDVISGGLNPWHQEHGTISNWISRQEIIGEENQPDRTLLRYHQDDPSAALQNQMRALIGQQHIASLA